ncbi:hypothetical protein [Methanobrevibacter filiformis]|uniref:Uncharacterized protein n=1 Tax=Methanobrevibacter filiformis TaxID=55758 RepID=A0A166CTL1_9EURY|nr:hypothetical protein [Methanobrevibacter filiformis]KZX14851.1 hypothetical protein MBFIL_07910 [Methanobrevibacter filiformis]
MTAEIAILNNNALVFASDSAGTVNYQSRNQINDSFNKIFMLSKYEPVGIMIYQNLNFFDISWETIISIYRDKLGKKKFNHLNDYINDFFNFIECNFKKNEEEQERYIIKAVKWIVEDILGTSNDNGLNKEYLENLINEKLANLKDSVNESWDNIPKEFIDLILKKYRNLITSEINNSMMYCNIPFNLLSSKYFNKLIEIAQYILYEDYTGVVFGGFGEDEVHPSVISVNVGKIFNIGCAIIIF